MMKHFRLLPAISCFATGLYLLFEDPGVGAYSAVAVFAFIVLLVECCWSKSFLQPFNLFCIFFFFYNFTSHFLFELSQVAVLGAYHSDENRNNIVYQALIAYCFLVGCAPWFVRGLAVRRETVAIRLDLIRIRLVPRRLFLLSVVVFLLAAAVYAPMLPIVLQNGFIDRVESSKYISSNLWLLVGLLSYVGSFLCILAAKRDRLYASMALALFGSYFLMDMTIGGRKILFYLVLTVVPWMWASRAFKAKHLVYASLAVILPIVMRGMIDKVDLVERDLAGIAAGVFGEFLFTSGTGYIIDANYQAICGNVDISSYFYWLIYLIPRAVYDSKPYSLAIDFANYMDLGMGFALTPVAEAYCVGHQAAWIFLTISTISMFAITALLARRSVIIYLITMALAMDINRGEFSYTVVQMATLFIVYKLFIKIASQSTAVREVNTSGLLSTPNLSER